MRNWIDLVENMERPAMVFHGTPTENLILIFRDGTIHARDCDEGHLGVSFSADVETAANFANWESRDGDLLHTEILHRDHPTFGGAVLMTHIDRLPRTEHYIDGGGEEDYESEWRTHGDVSLDAIETIFVRRSELEQYRATLLDAQANHTVKGWNGIDPEMEAKHLKWAEAFLRDGTVLAALDRVLADPRLREPPPLWQF